MKGNTRGPILIAITAVLWSFGGLFIKMIPQWHAMTIIGMRAVFAAVILAVYMKKPRITFSPSVILGGVCMAGTTIFFVYATTMTTAANAIVLQYTGPIYVILLSILFFRKRPRALDVMAVLVTVAGIAMCMLDPQSKTEASNPLLGNVLACLSGITFAGVFLINQMPKAKPEESLLLGHLINIVVCMPVVLTNITFDLTPWIIITLLGVFQLGLAYVLFSIGIKITPPITASLIAALEPLLNPVWVFLFLPTHERPGNWALVGGAIVLVAVVAYNVISIRQQRRLPEDTTGTGVAV